VLERVLRNTEITETCWLWKGRRNKTGYGIVRDETGKRTLVHQLVFLRVRGAVPEGLEPDHTCKVKHCIRPDHLEPVTHQENIRRRYGGLCKRGLHEMTESNVIRNGKGRLCRACKENRPPTPTTTGPARRGAP